MKKYMMHVFALTFFCPFVIAQDDMIAKEDLVGPFLFSLDVPGPHCIGEISFLNNTECTIRMAFSFEPVGPLCRATFSYEDGIIKVDSAENDMDKSCQGTLTFNLKNTKRHRVLEAITSPDPEEESNGTEIKTGSRILIWRSNGDFVLPFRFLKYLHGGSYFSKTESKCGE